MHPSQPPVVDIAALVENAPNAAERIASQIRRPCETLGLFHVTGHGVPDTELVAFDRAMRRLFALPSAEKAKIRRTRENAWGYYDRELTKNRRDWKEVFDYGREAADGCETPTHSDGRNQWPAAAPDLAPTLRRHHASCERIARALLQALCVSLGLAPDRLDPYFEPDSSFTRLNYYPPCPDPAPPDAALLPERGQLAVHHHSDAGALTILYQAEVGLQAWTGDRFLLVEPVPGAFTVNLGDMLQVWSNDRYRSPIHRVLARADAERYSAPFFLNPRYDVVCEPILPRHGGTATPRFRPVSWAHFRDQRSAGDFDDYGAEIQVEDYRIEGG